MIVKCISNRGEDLPAECLDSNSGFSKTTTFNLEIGKHYLVYGVTLFLGYIWYFLEDEAFSYYPIWNPSPLFEIVDGRLSRYWICSFKNTNNGNFRTIFAFKEWANSPTFYEKLVDGEKEAVHRFAFYKERMDSEFVFPSVSIWAENLDGNWVMCPNCQEAWEGDSLDEMVKCSKCCSLLINPKRIPSGTGQLLINPNPARRGPLEPR